MFEFICTEEQQAILISEFYFSCIQIGASTQNFIPLFLISTFLRSHSARPHIIADKGTVTKHILERNPETDMEFITIFSQATFHCVVKC